MNETNLKIKSDFESIGKLSEEVIEKINDMKCKQLYDANYNNSNINNNVNIKNIDEIFQEREELKKVNNINKINKIENNTLPDTVKKTNLINRIKSFINKFLKNKRQ